MKARAEARRSQATPPAAGPGPARGAALAAAAALALASAGALASAAWSAWGAQAPRAGETSLRVNPNTASREELVLLPRIGPALADALIRFREESSADPAFECADDLLRVPRIGPKTMEGLRPHLRFD